jgi:hypothetical protein
MIFGISTIRKTAETPMQKPKILLQGFPEGGFT